MNIHADQLVRAPSMRKAIDTLASAKSSDNAIEPVDAVISGAAHGNAILDFIRTVVYWAARGIIFPVEVCARKQIGARYHNGAVLAAFVGSQYLISHVARLYGDGLSTIFSGIAFFFYFRHANTRSQAQRKGVHWHSYAEGTSRLHFDAIENAWRARMGPFTTFSWAKNVLEPGVLLAAYVLLLIFAPLRLREYHFLLSSPAANYFLIAGVTAAGYQVYCWSVRRSQLLDYLDAELMMDAHSESISPGQSGGIHEYRGASYFARPVASALRTADRPGPDAKAPIAWPNEPRTEPARPEPGAQASSPLREVSFQNTPPDEIFPEHARAEPRHSSLSRRWRLAVCAYLTTRGESGAESVRVALLRGFQAFARG